MHKHLRAIIVLFTAVLFLESNNLNGQTLTIAGSGTSSSYLYSPIYSWNAAPRTQRIAYHYPAAQLTAGLMPSGATINSIAFQRASATGALAGTTNLKIYMENRPSTSLDLGAGTLTWATILAPATLVYDDDPAPVVGSTAGWKTFTFGTGPGAAGSFVYSGGAIVVYAEYSQTGAPAANINWNYQSATTGTPAPTGWTSNSTKYTTTSTTTPSPTIASSTANHPHTEFTYSTGPCTSPPSAGTATSNASNPTCQGSTVNLSLIGSSTGSGLSYQWESSPSATGPFVPFGAPSGSYPTSITATSSVYYRAAVTCLGATDYSVPVLVNVSTQMAGTYTIDNNFPTAGTNFASFTDALAGLLACGISGPVVLDVVTGSGPYNEQITIPAVPGASATNTITINGNGTTLTYAASASATPHTLGLNGADYITVNNLSITGTGATYALSCHLWGGADNNTFSQCTFSSPVNSSATTQVPFSISGSATVATTAGLAGSNNIITNCTMNNGYHDVAIVGGTTTSIAVGNQLINCNLNDYYQYGVYLSNQNGAVVKNNMIERSTRTTLPGVTSTSAGIGVVVVCTNLLIDGNRIKNPFGGALTNAGISYGIYSNISATAGNENRYYNNLIYDMNGNGIRAGIYLTGNYAKIYHNTISFDETTAYGVSTTTHGIWLSSATAAGLDVQNNVISIRRGGLGAKQCLKYTSATGITSNNNDLFMFSAIGTNYVGTFGSSGFNTLGAWQLANGGVWDAQSKNVDPLYTNPASGDFTPLESALNNVGNNLAVTTDILGATRGTPPDLGAYEFTPPACGIPIAGTASANPLTVCSGNNLYLSLSGQSTGNGQTVQWESYNAATSLWSPAVGANMVSPVIIPSVSTQYRAAVTCGANTQYSNAISVRVNTTMTAGTYTIDNAVPTGGTNFTSFADAAANLNCGISGPVVINVVPGSGPYNEQVTIQQIPGASSTNTITINGNGTTLAFNAPTISAPHTLMLEGTDYMTVNNLTVTNNGNTYGLACHLWDQADNNTFSNCTFVGSTTTTTATVAPFSISGSPNGANTQGVSGNNNLITGCTIIGGYYSMTLVGIAATLSTGNQVVNCNMKDWYTTGPYMYYQDGAIIRGNLIERPTRTVTTTAYGIYVLTGCTNSLIENNRIRSLFEAIPTSTSTCYGIYSSADASAGFENKYYNNIISDLKGNGIQAGIYLTGATYAKVYHNTVSLDYQAATATGATYGIYSTGAAAIQGADVKNNIITIKRGGNAAKYCLYFSNLNTSNNNDLFIVPNGTVNNVGFFGGDFLSLASWQTANGGIYDLQSKDLQPLYANPGANDFTPTEWQIDNMGVSVGVTNDILGAVRAAIPDVGAIEFLVPPCITPPLGGTATTNMTNVCAGSSIILSVTGQTTGAGTVLQWQYYDAGTSSWINIGGATTATYGISSIGATTQYRAATTCSGNTAYSNVTQINVVPVFASTGTYTLNSALPTGGTNFQTIQALDSALMCGLSGALTINVNSAGTYSGQLHLKDIGSPAAPIVINGNGATFTYSPTDDMDRACIKMDNADFVTVNNLNIVAPTGALYAFGIQMINDADQNTISGCTISCDVFVTGGTHCGISISGSHNAANVVGSNCDSALITGCTINGGVYGVSSFGDGLTNPIYGNRIINNTILNSYNVPIYLNGNNGALIQNNDISRPDRINSGNAYGVYLQAGNISCVVNANKVHNMFDAFNGSANPQYSFAIAGPGVVGFPCVFSNNIVYNQNNTRGVQYGLFNNGGSQVNFYYNTIVSDFYTNTPSTAATAGYFQQGTATGIEVKNNIFKITRAGTGVRAGLYFAAAPTTFVSDYNDIYVNTGGAADMIGFINTPYTTLGAWQAAPGTPDLNSKDVDPGFTIALSGVLIPTSPQVNNQGTVVSTTSDIANTARSATPDIGAYEFSVPTCSPVLSFTSANIGTTTATISWTGIAGSAGYEYVVSTSTTPPAGAGTTVVPATLSLTGLSPATRYYFYLRNNCGGSGFSPWSSYKFTTKPVNDDCLNAIDLTSQMLISGTTVGATETQLPGPCVTTTAYANDVWYYFTLTQMSNVTLNVTNLTGDLVMETHSGTCGSFTSMDCQDSPAVGTEVSTFANLAAGTYYVRAYGFLSIEAPFTIQALITPLSIKLSNIAAVNIGNSNRVTWTSNSEDKGDYFELERSADGLEFTRLASIQGKENAAQYSFVDATAFSGVNYYRLKLLDAQGKYSYSRIVSATVRNGAFSINAFPNPVNDRLQVEVIGTQGNNAAIAVTDMQGKIIFKMEDVTVKTSVDMSGLAPGVYMVRYSDSNQNKVMKITRY